MKAEHVGIYLKLNKGADNDIIQRLNDQKNKQGYIKELIRTDASLDSLRHSFEHGITKVVQTRGKNDGQHNPDQTEGET